MVGVNERVHRDRGTGLERQVKRPSILNIYGEPPDGIILGITATGVIVCLTRYGHRAV
mgnify:CR=1 FL=1